MPTIEQQLNELVKQKNALATALRDKGVEAEDNETLNSLVPKVGEIKSGSGLNIHYGDTAPEDTSMLWIKSSETISGVHIACNLNVASKSTTSIMAMSNQYLNYNIASVGNMVYQFGGQIYKDSLDSGETALSGIIYKYDIKNKTKVSLGYLGSSLYLGHSPIASYGTDIYLFGYRYYTAEIFTTTSSRKELYSSNKIVKFDTLTNTSTNLSVTVPEIASSAITIGTNIYIFGSSIYKFDTLTQTIETLDIVPPITSSNLVAIETNIYLVGSSTIYKFDTKLNTIVDLNVDMPRGYTGGAGGSNSTISPTPAVIGTDIYLFGGGHYSTSLGTQTYNTIYKFDTIMNNLVLLYDTCNSYQYYSNSILNIDNDIYIFGGVGRYSSTASTLIQKFTDNRINESKNDITLILSTVENTLNIYEGDNKNCIYSKLPAYLYQGGSWTKISRLGTADEF